MGKQHGGAERQGDNLPQTQDVLCEGCQSAPTRVLGSKALSETKIKLSSKGDEHPDTATRRASYDRQVGKDPLDSVPLVKVASRRILPDGSVVIRGRLKIGTVRLGTKRTKR